MALCFNILLFGTKKTSPIKQWPDHISQLLHVTITSSALMRIRYFWTTLHTFFPLKLDQ